MKISQQLWLDSEERFLAITEHDFTLQLKTGELLREHFDRFITQDMLYLKYNSEAFRITADRAKNLNEKEFFAMLSTEGIAFEQLMQKELSDEFNITPAAELDGVFEAYCNYLIDTAKFGGYHESVTALLPCFWYYAEIGRQITEEHKRNNRYGKWLATYSDPFFQSRVRQYVDVVDKIGETANEKERQQMFDGFRKSAQFELEVFDYACFL